MSSPTSLWKMANVRASELWADFMEELLHMTSFKQWFHISSIAFLEGTQTANKVENGRLVFSKPPLRKHESII